MGVSEGVSSLLPSLRCGFSKCLVAPQRTSDLVLLFICVCAIDSNGYSTWIVCVYVIDSWRQSVPARGHSRLFRPSNPVRLLSAIIW